MQEKGWGSCGQKRHATATSFGGNSFLFFDWKMPGKYNKNTDKLPKRPQLYCPTDNNTENTLANDGCPWLFLDETALTREEQNTIAGFVNEAEMGKTSEMFLSKYIGINRGSDFCYFASQGDLAFFFKPEVKESKAKDAVPPHHSSSPGVIRMARHDANAAITAAAVTVSRGGCDSLLPMPI